MPQAALPEILKLEEEVLKIGRGNFISLLGKELGDRLRVEIHDPL